MGRGRGKGKKQIIITAHEDHGSGEDEKIPGFKRRGRPQKPLKDEIEDLEEEELAKIEEDEENEEKVKKSITSLKNSTPIENGRKRKRSPKAKENAISMKGENDGSSKTSTKSMGFRQNGSRRKNKPRRAAEAGVECK